MNFVLLLTLSLLCGAAGAAGQITVQQAAMCNGSASNCTAPMTMTPGDMIFALGIRAETTNTQISSPCVSGAWTVDQFQIGTLFYQLSIGVATSGGSCNITYTNGGGGVNGSWSAVSYTGVQSVSGPVLGGAGLSSPCTGPPITTTVANSAILGIHYVTGSVVRTFTPVAGTTIRGEFRVQNFNAYSIFVERMMPTPGTDTTGVGYTGGQGVCTAFGMVLVPALIQPPETTNAVLSHQSKTVVLDTVGMPQYALPNTMISPSWCTYVLGAQDSTVTVAASALLNTQANPLDLRAWNMSRMCQDIQSNYWAAAPILTGAGVSATRTPTGIQLSLSARIAGGGMRLGGGVLGAGRCRMTTRNAKGVSPEDVVNFSLAEDPRSIPGFAYLGIGVAAKENQVDFHVCNRSGRTMKLSAFTLNWEAK